MGGLEELQAQDKRIADRFGATEVKVNPYFDMICGAKVYVFRLNEVVVKICRVDLNSLTDLTPFNCYSMLIDSGGATLVLKFSTQLLENCDKEEFKMLLKNEINRIKRLPTKNIR